MLLSFFRTPALSVSATQRLEAAAQSILGGKHPSIQTEYRFAIETSAPLTDDERKAMDWLLSETFEPRNSGHLSYLSSCKTVLEVGPRLTVETAYSTTARAVFKLCGIDKVTRVERSTRYGFDLALNDAQAERFLEPLHDRMTQMRYPEDLTAFPAPGAPEPVRIIDALSAQGRANLEAFCQANLLSWDDQDYDFILWLFRTVLQRDPTDTELFQLAQLLSEHCRHWRFRGVWTIDEVEMALSLMEIIKAPYLANPAGSIIAFNDDSSAIHGGDVRVLMPQDSRGPGPYTLIRRLMHHTLTAETHNHPTMIEPYEGSATLDGGVKRDQMVIGRGGRIGLLLIGFATGNWHVPGYPMSWEAGDWKVPKRIATPLQIALRGTAGAFDYGNCFGQPVAGGFFRTFGQTLPSGEYCSWFKPVAYGAAAGSIDNAHITKDQPRSGMSVALIGGAAYRIGIGGGSGSSRIGDEADSELEFDSVQRGAPEMERRLYDFHEAAIDLRENNPVRSCSDLGAGGLSTTGPEKAEPAGADIDIDSVPSGDASLSVTKINSCEAQERNLILVNNDDRQVVVRLAERSGVPLAFIGEIIDTGRYVLRSKRSGQVAIDLPLHETLGDLPRKKFSDKRVQPRLLPLQLPSDLTADAALDRVLRLPSVASKKWLVTRVDRSVTGLVAQQQCVGPGSVPVADYAIKADGYFDFSGAAFALGEQPLKGLISPQAMVRMAVSEALLNLSGARITGLNRISGSANWMLNIKKPGNGAWLYDAAVALKEFLIALGVKIDGGKDSLSMGVSVKSPEGKNVVVSAPGQFVFAPYAAMPDIRFKATPVIKAGQTLVYVDLGHGKDRLGGSALAQAFQQIGDMSPDIDPTTLGNAFHSIQEGLSRRLIAGIHDRSDGGLVTTLLEMAFAGNAGLDIDLHSSSSPFEHLFNEEAGVVISSSSVNVKEIQGLFAQVGLEASVIGTAVPASRGVTISHNGKKVIRRKLPHLLDAWEETSYQMEKLLREPSCVESERRHRVSLTRPPYRVSFPFPMPYSIVESDDAPAVAIIREQGSNGHREMAAAFTAAGFRAYDVTMKDLLSGAITLDRFRGVVFVGGFSYADVLDSAKGWAGVIRFNPIREQFEQFRSRSDTFAFGVCNGCQLMALMGWIPGLEVVPEDQPRFVHNESGLFESRFVSVRIFESPAIMLKRMAGSTLGVWLSHGEGCFRAPKHVTKQLLADNLVPLRYVGPQNQPVQTYPFNPNGSPHGIAGACSPDGRSLALMPHAERTFQPWQWPWAPPEWGSDFVSPWMQMFHNAYDWCMSTR